MLSEDLHIDRILIMGVDMDQDMDPTAVTTLNTTTTTTKKRTRIIHITMEILLEHSEIMPITNLH